MQIDMRPSRDTLKLGLLAALAAGAWTLLAGAVHVTNWTGILLKAI